MRHSMERIAVVVGDAALISGLSLEALNDIGHRQTQLLIVLNDNAMSISPTVGAFSQYFSTLKLSSRLEAEQEGLRQDRRVAAGRRPARPEAVAAHPAHGRQLRPAGPALRGPRDHLPGRHPGPQPARPRAHLPRRARRARAGAGPRADAQGARLPPGRARPDRIPRCGPAAHAGRWATPACAGGTRRRAGRP